MDLGIFDLDTLERMKRDAIEVAFMLDATIERRLAAHEAIVLIDRELDKRIEWALDVRHILVELGGEG